MSNQFIINKKALIKAMIFCLSGLIVIPMMLRDCAAPFTPTSRTFVPPAESHLIGTYLPDAKTVEYIVSVQERLGVRSNLDVQININRGGFELRDIPRLLKQEGPRSLISFSRRKSWNTFYEGDTWRMYFDSDYKDGIKADVLGDRPPYRIRLVVGDPSINEPLIFTKFER